MSAPRPPRPGGPPRPPEPHSLPDRDEARAREVAELEKRVAAGWVFDCTKLYPIDRDEIEKLRQNPNICLWLNRIKRLRATYGKVTLTGVRQHVLAKQRNQSGFKGKPPRTMTEKEIDSDGDEGDESKSIKRSIANVPIVGEEKHAHYICTRRAWLEACVQDRNDLDRMLEKIQRHAPSGSKLDEMPIIREAKVVPSKHMKIAKNFVRSIGVMGGWKAARRRTLEDASTPGALPGQLGTPVAPSEPADPTRPRRPSGARDAMRPTGEAAELLMTPDEAAARVQARFRQRMATKNEAATRVQAEPANVLRDDPQQTLELEKEATKTSAAGAGLNAARNGSIGAVPAEKETAASPAAPAAPASPKSPSASAKGRAGLLKSLRTGELEQVVDKMEESSAATPATSAPAPGGP